MWKRMMRWCRGYVLVELRGAAQERFFNLCRRHNIYLWNIYTVALSSTLRQFYLGSAPV